MVIKLLVKLLGGIWSLKERCLSSNNSFFIRLYNIYLDSKGSFVGFNAKIDGIPIFPHGINGIFISGDSKIGKNSVIYHQVTIGSNTIPGSNNGSPTIGENCYVGAGAKIIGNVVIGDNVRIGANCIVFQDVPSNSVVVSQAPRIIQKENLINRFYSKNNGKWGYLQNGSWVVEEDIEILRKLAN